MKTFKTLLITLSLLTVASSLLRADNKPMPAVSNANLDMYVIEREIPDAGKFSPEKLQAISRTSCGVLTAMGPQNIQWLHSYVTGDKIYCVYLAVNEQAVREHARRGGFPANSVTRVATVISPKTAE